MFVIPFHYKYKNYPNAPRTTAKSKFLGVMTCTAMMVVWTVLIWAVCGELLWEIGFYISHDLAYFLAVIPAGLFVSLMPEWKKSRIARLDRLAAAEANGSAVSNQTGNLVLICHGGEMNGRVYPLGPSGVTIGRGRENSIQYSDNSAMVSRYHAKLFWAGNQLELMDVGSSNGTFMDKRGRLAAMSPVPVHAGSVFYIGSGNNAFEIAVR